MGKAVMCALVVLLLSIPAVAAPVKHQTGVPSGNGWGSFVTKGTIITMDKFFSKTFTLRVENALSVHGNPHAPGQVNRVMLGSTVFVRTSPQTVIGMGSRTEVRFNSLMVGDRVEVWGARQPDGSVTALRVQVLGQANGTQPARIHQ